MIVKLGVALVLALTMLPWGAQAVAPPVPKGHVIFEEGTWMPLADAPAYEFDDARVDFISKDYTDAARHLRKGVAFLNVEASRAQGEDKAQLSSSVEELEKLAKEIQKGQMNSLEGLDNAIARAEYALAAHHRILALGAAQAEKNAKWTAHHMRATATHLEHALTWAGHEGEQAVVAAVTRARTVASKLIAGSEWASAEVGNALTALGDGIEKVGQWVQPRKRQ